MAATDFKIIFVEAQNDKMHFLSTNKTKLTGGISKLIQKVVHGLLTRVGDDLYAPSWGCYIPDIIYKPYDQSRKSEVYTEIVASVKKVEQDVKRMQLLQESEGNIAILDFLTLRSLEIDYTTNRWIISLNLKPVGGTEQFFNL